MTTTVNEPSTCVESITLMEELDKRVALVTVRLGDVQVRGVAVWRSGNGRLRVHFPGYKLGWSWDDAVHVSDELRSEIEADVIAAYKAAKAAKKEETEHSSQANVVKLGQPPAFKFPGRKFPFEPGA
jgi:hypothetical protein